MRLLKLLPLFILLTACGGGNRQKTEPKVNTNTSSDHTELASLKAEFIKAVITPLQEDLVISLETYEIYQKELDSINSNSNTSIEFLAQKDLEFESIYGKSLRDTNTNLQRLKDLFKTKKENLIKDQEEISNLKSRFESNKSEYEDLVSAISITREAINNMLHRVETTIASKKSEILILSDKAKAEESNAKRYYRDAGRGAGRIANKRLVDKAINASNRAKALASAANSKINELNTYVATENEKITSRVRQVNLHSENTRIKGEELKTLAQFLTTKANAFNSGVAELQRIIESFKIKKLYYKELALELEKYKSNRNEIINLVEGQLFTIASHFNNQNEEIIKKYGNHIYQTFPKVIAWLSKKKPSNEETEILLNELRSKGVDTEDYQKIIIGLEKIYDYSKSLTFIEKKVNRAIANDLLGGLGIRLGSIKLPNFNIINIRIDIPEIKIAHLAINLPSLNIDLSSLELPNLDLNLDLSNINSSVDLSNIRIFDLALPEIRVERLNIVNVKLDLKQDIKNFIDALKIPEIQFARFEARVDGDIRNPGRIYENWKRELTRARENTERELTRAREDVDREATKAYQDLKRETDSGIHKMGLVMEAAGQPKNLARIAVVYMASIYAGPAGSAFANALLDKLENPNMSEADMLKSFAIGAAAGYVAEYAGNVDIEVLQKMPNASAAIARNLTTDAGNVLLNGENYSFEDFVSSVGSGALNVNMGDSLASDVIESGINAAKDYAVNEAAHHRGVDEDLMDEAFYRGLANGLTREAVHRSLEIAVVSHIPDEQKRMDKKAIEAFGDFLYSTYVVERDYQEEEIKKNYSNLSEQEKHKLEQWYAEKNRDIIENASQDAFGKKSSELTPDDLSNPRFQGLLKIYSDNVEVNDSSIRETIAKIRPQYTSDGREIAGAAEKYIVRIVPNLTVIEGGIVEVGSKLGMSSVLSMASVGVATMLHSSDLGGGIDEIPVAMRDLTPPAPSDEEGWELYQRALRGDRTAEYTYRLRESFINEKVENVSNSKSNIKITLNGLKHVMERHTDSGLIKFTNKSKFNPSEDVVSIILSASEAPRKVQRNNYYSRTFDTGRNIGIDRSTKMQTSFITVITNDKDELITAYPGQL